MFSRFAQPRPLWIITAFCLANQAHATKSPSCEQLLLEQRKTQVAYEQIPGVVELRLPRSEPAELTQPREASAGVSDVTLEAGRKHGAFDDFKPLSDATPRKLSESEKQELANGTVYIGHFIERAYDFGSESQPAPAQLLGSPKTVSTGDAKVDAALNYVERTWPELVRVAVPREGGSLLPLPYPHLVPAGRFQEAYYWDTYFGVLGLLATGRLELAQMQAENMLELVRRHGMVPNGTRDYYLSRSQPPLLTSLVRDVFTRSPRTAQSLRWLRERAYPLMRAEYENFWMNPQTRFDERTQLNHHWDEIDLPRPERHSFDKEAELGRTYRDVRAAAESGLDFTKAFEGEASQVAGVLLNSLLYKNERDLEWAARTLNLSSEAKHFAARAKRRRAAMNRYLWNEALGRFENYNLRSHRRIAVLTADTFAPLFANVASPDQALRVRAQLGKLEQRGGLMSSELTDSTHQWDGDNGWAPQHVIAIQGLRNYNLESDARRLAAKWVEALARIHDATASMFERIDVKRVAPPATSGSKYPVQKGFLWTNASFEWALVEVLGVQVVER